MDGKGFLVTFAVLVLLAVAGLASAEDNSCIDCHKTLSPFTAQQERFNQIRISHIARNVTCSLECHEDRILQLSRDNYNQWSESAHAYNNVTCEKCHGGNPAAKTKEAAHKGIKAPTELDSPVYYKNVPKTCGKEGCHLVELEHFENSMHYQRLQAVKLAPSCSTCHAPHTFKVLDPEVFRGFCIQCHYVGKVAPVEVPTKAEYALEAAEKLKHEITEVRRDILFAEKEGKDVGTAKAEIDKAVKVINDLPETWHAFNLENFEQQEEIAKKAIAAARQQVSPTPTPTLTPTATPPTPGFGIAAAILGIFAIAVLRRITR
jgi:hypothetical protein